MENDLPSTSRALPLDDVNSLRVIGEEESRSGKRAQEEKAASFLKLDLELLPPPADGLPAKGLLRGYLTVTTTSPHLRFAEDWSLFSSIAFALQQDESKGFWCARVPANSQDLVVLHQPQAFLTAVDPLQICRLSHDAFNSALSIQLLVYPSQARYYGKRPSERKREHPRNNPSS